MSDEETIDAPSRSWQLTLFIFLMKTATWLGVIIAGSFAISMLSLKCYDYITWKAEVAYAIVLDYLPQREVHHFISSDNTPVEKIFVLFSQEIEVDAILLTAMAQQESGVYEITNRVKFEPHLLQSWKDDKGRVHPPQINPPRNLNNIEKQLWASSHGILQVIFGFHYKTCNLPENSWNQLYDPLINIRCGAHILKSYAARYSNIKDQSQRVWLALRDYNGSDAYADEVMARVVKMRGINFGKGL